MDLIIERDEHAEQVFEGQIGHAALDLQNTLGIPAEVARQLIDGGMGDLRMLATGEVDVDDVSGVLGGDRALAEQILAKAQTNSSVSSAE
jgi:hypothetical protein